MKSTQIILVLASFVALSLLTGVAAQDRSNAEQEAKISDPNQECTPYYWAGSADHKTSFPPIWEPASILSSDTAAQAKWNEIKDKVPNIAPKGTHNGDFSGVNYPADDPDCWWTTHQCVTPKLSGLPVDISSVPEPMTLGYGFDDGPNCSHNAFYDYLLEQNQKATMFFIGSNVIDWPLEAQRAINEGHEICVHTWSHNYMTSFTSEDAFAELWYTMQAIKLVIGVTPTCWRPPFGDVDDRIRAIANGLGLETIIWKYDSFDWEVSAGKLTPEQVDGNYQGFIGLAQKGEFDTEGAILLMHEINAFTMSEAIKFYPQLKAAFKAIVPVGVALNKTQPYVETDYTLPTFEEYISGTTNKSEGSNLSPTTTSGNTGTSTTSVSGARANTTASASGSSGSNNSTGSRSTTANGASSTILLSPALQIVVVGLFMAVSIL